MSEQRPRSLTGIKPSGTPHLGNLLGAIRPALELARGHDAYYFIADYHALTTVHDAERMRSLTHELAATWLASGLDPEEVVFFRQSDVPEVFELAWALGCFAGKGLLNRAHAYKAVVQENEAAGRDRDAGVSVGLYTYPVLMAADILLYDSDVVPVGRDQKQHVEIARDIASAVNHVAGSEVLHLPAPRIDDDVATITGLDGRKMSKSYDNVIPLFAPPKRLRKLVMSITTDSASVEDAKDPESCNVFALYRLFAEPGEVEELAGRYRAGGMGYGEAKQLLFEAIDAQVAPARERYEELVADTAALDAVLADGAARARTRATATMQRVRSALGIGPLR